MRRLFLKPAVILKHSQSVRPTSKRNPLLKHENGYVVALPTAISFALRNFIVEFADRTKTLHILASCMALEYERFLSGIRLFGEAYPPIPPLKFCRQDGHLTLEFMMEFDKGRYVHFILFADDLTDIAETDICGVNPSPAKMENLFDKSIQEAMESASENCEFREGASLLVHCGVGRGAMYSISRPSTENWFIENLDAPTLFALSSCDDISTTTLFRINDAVGKA